MIKIRLKKNGKGRIKLRSKDRTLLNQVDDRLKNTNQNEELAKTPLKFFTEFVEKNILASVKANTSEDVLGLFYGEFIRFSGGDGQTLGVVLTPSHITEMFCDLIDLRPTDIVFDPCCGSGSHLLVAKQNNRKYLGFEINKKYFDLANKRLNLSNLLNK